MGDTNLEIFRELMVNYKDEPKTDKEKQAENYIVNKKLIYW